MKLALIGADAESLRLAEAARRGGHQIVWHGDVSAAGDTLPHWLAVDDLADNWEDLLDSEIVDAVIIGRGSAPEELRARQLQEFVRLGQPMLAVFPLFSSVLTYFEVDMARTESGAVLQHFNPLAVWPLMEQWAQWVQSGHPELGGLEQINCVRAQVDRSRESVLWHFARDVDMVDRLAGRLNRIGAHAASAGEAASYAALSVQLLGALEVPVRWSVEPPARGEGLTLTLVFQRGRITAEFDAGDRYLESGARASRDLSLESHAVERFVADVATGDGERSSWPHALHAMELVDSIEISLRRGRMIDVHDQQLTEHLAFKGTMAAVSCGVLVVLVPLMLFLGWIAGQLGIPVANYWPHLLLALLALFLGMQVLPKLLYEQPPKSAPSEAVGKPSEVDEGALSGQDS
jgi:hypothetical protein